MDADPRALAETQRRLWRLITAPSGVRAALREAGDPQGRRLSEWLRAGPQGSAIDRLEVYANAYFYRILECLADDYPALQDALGEGLFRDLATAYLHAHPPRHPSLRHAGDRLAAFLRTPAAEPFRRRCAWAPDLAALEGALVDAFDAADAPELSRRALAGVPPEAWDSLRFAFQPALRAIAVEWPVHRLRSARDRGLPAPGSLERDPGHICVWRRNERVFHRPLGALEAEALALAQGGARFGILCQHLADRVGAREAPERAAALLAEWQGGGWLSGIRSADQP